MPPVEITDRLVSWGSDVDDGTITQALKASRLPIVSGHVALMPDAHVGIGATIGSVVPTEGAIIPSAVGVDIGCGMAAVRLDVREDQLPDDLRPLLSRIERAVPAGVGKGTEGGSDAAGRWLDAHRPPSDLAAKEAKKAYEQFGSLGSGNHFFELCIDEAGSVWVLLHSGSRGIGNLLAQRHIGKARHMAKAMGQGLEDPDLAWFTQGTPEFDAYVADMLWAQDYARANRDRMLDRSLRVVKEFLGTGRELERVNCFSGETEVLTRAGTRPIASLAGGTHELLTSNGVWVKAPVAAFGRQQLWKVTLSRSGALKDIYATAGHRWLVRARAGELRDVVTHDLHSGDRLAYAFPDRADDVALDGEAAARGFVFGDGSRTPYRSVANFCGEKDEAMLPFFADARPPRTYAGVRRIHGLPLEWKTTLPSLDAPAAALYGWLAGYFAADGDVDRTGRPTLSSARREHLEFVRQLCTCIGVGTFGIRRRERTGFGKTSALYLVGLMRGDLCPEFFLIPEHRRRFEAGRDAAERRGWNVVAVEPTDRVEEVFCAVVDGTHTFTLADNILTGNCHHNFAALEEHDGRALWITRKGAIEAKEGQLGLIPGSMGTRSYVVRGKGNPRAWRSCSHGAGRRLSRTAAKKRYTAHDLAEQMQGRVWLRDRAKALVDEIPAAYKDIDRVMADQQDLVDVVHTLRQVLNYKGTN